MWIFEDKAWVWLFIIAFVVSPVSLYLARRFSYTKFFKFMRQNRDLILVITSLLFGIYITIISRIHTLWTNVFWIMLVMGIFLYVKDNLHKS